MNKQDATQHLKEWVLTHARGERRSLLAEHLLMKEGYIDSLGMMSLITHVEQLLGHEIPDELMSFDNFESIQKIADIFFGEVSHES